MGKIAYHPTNLADVLPFETRLIKDLQVFIPKIARDNNFLAEIEKVVRNIPTRHRLFLADSRRLAVPDQSVHLIVTSPPYWILKKYRESEGQLGFISEYETFLKELNKIWRRCFRALVPGGRLICVVGDVCLARRRNNGEHTVVPLHSSIQEQCRKIGFKNLAPIIWHKITNASYEVDGGSSFLGKPYEPNAVIKNDIEFILMERKPGGYRKPSRESRLLSVISYENHKKWFQQIWSGITGASTKLHPAPFPLELVERLIRMFSFVGDTVLDPFMGTGTTNIAAAKWGRHSIGIELDSTYFEMATNRFEEGKPNLAANINVEVKLDG